MDRHDLIWNPWHGCHKHSEGCQNCYAFFLDKRYGRDTNEVVRNKSGFDLPIKKDRVGNYKMPPKSNVRVCMASDFFIEEADEWREEAWEIIRKRPDLMYLLSETGVDAKPLYDAFFAEPEQSLETYDGVRLRVHGVASRVGIDIHGLPSVEMSDRVNGECYVLCVFRDSGILNAVQAGEEVTIEGNYLVFYDGFGITMKNSELLEKCEKGDDV